MSEETTEQAKPDTVSGLFEPLNTDGEPDWGYRSHTPRSKGGYLRSISLGDLERLEDPRISSDLSRRLGLRGGERITGTVERSSPRTPGLLIRVDEVTEINGRPASEYGKVKPVEDRKASDPYRQIRFETEGGPLPMRVIDLMFPIGFGQRSVIVAPPRSGRSILLQQIAHGVAANYSDVDIITLLIDERPEDVTDIRRSVPGEVIASSSDRQAKDHVRLTNLVIERAKRSVEMGKDVLILVDSLTRLARAVHTVVPPQEQREIGSLDSACLQPARNFFNAAQNIDEGGSLTIIATLLVEEGIRNNDLLAEDFASQANSRIVLSSDLVENRVWPAIDIAQSGTDQDELMLSSEAIETSRGVRKELKRLSPPKAMKKLLSRLREYETNEDLILAIE